MAYISYLEESQVPEELQDLFEQVKRQRGKVLNSFKLLAHRPRLLRAFYPLLREIRVPQSRALNNGLKELIHLKVSSLNHCHYCITHSYHLAQAFRRSPEELLRLLQGDLSGFTDEERIALELGEAIATDRVDAALIERAKAHFSEGEIVELVMTVGVFVLLNLFNRTLGTDLDAPAGPAELYEPPAAR